MINDRRGTLTAPRRDNETQTKRETDQLCLSFGFASLGRRARLITVSEPGSFGRRSLALGLRRAIGFVWARRRRRQRLGAGLL